jgi:hypothetical protein
MIIPFGLGQNIKDLALGIHHANKSNGAPM